MTFHASTDKWLATESKSRRQSTARQAKTHLKTIRQEFGPMTLAVTAWTGNLKDQYTPSNIYALCRRLTHLLDVGAEDC
jgi:hypothetical protein